MKSIIKFAVTAVISVAIVSCSDSRAQKAAAMGEHDAMEFVQLKPSGKTGDLQRVDFILNIRYKERRLREAGFDKAADCYIEQFKTSLLEADSTLYAEIFVP